MDLFSELDKSYQNTKCNLDLERRFSCVVCLSPKFKMVYGLCQHKICIACGYDSNGALKMAFRRCPTCQQEDVFPNVRPNIPEDNIVAQKLCGIMVCKYNGCGQEVWAWEKEDHELFCSYRNCSPKCNGHYSVKDDYSSFTPKSSSRRRQMHGEFSDSENGSSRSTRGRTLRSHKMLKQQTSHSAKSERSLSKYNLRNHNRSAKT